MMIDVSSFQVLNGEQVDLSIRPTQIDAIYQSKKQYKKQLKRHVKQLSKLQHLLYAANRYSILIIFQAMDAAGKDGNIRSIMSGINPQGCQVFSFKHPSEMELDHDFLWRTNRCLPERGRIGIFNRSYYEDVLIARVHPEILDSQNLPDKVLYDDMIWQQRYQSINDLEHHLYRNGTHVIKFFLHLSKQEQRNRFIERIDNPDKNWKFTQADINERQYWDSYMDAYQRCLTETSSQQAPWYIVPADDKKTARLITSKIVVDTIAALDIDYPQVDDEQRAELVKIRTRLMKET